MDIKDTNGKLYAFELVDDVPAFFKCFFNTIACPALGKGTMVQYVVEKDGKLDVYSTDVKLVMEQYPCRHVLVLRTVVMVPVLLSGISSRIKMNQPSSLV